MPRHLGTLLAGAHPQALCCSRAGWGHLLRAGPRRSRHRATGITLSNASQLIQRRLLQINHSEQENLIETYMYQSGQ